MAAIRGRGLRVRAWLAMVAMGAGDLRRRRAHCLERESYHRAMLTWIPNHLSIRVTETEAEAERVASQHPHLAWHLDRTREFARAANCPWMAIPAESIRASDATYGCLCLDPFEP